MTVEPDTFAYAEGQSNLLKIRGLQDATTELPLTDTSGVTASALVYAVGSASPLGDAVPVSYVAGTKKWVGTLPATLPVSAGQVYDAVVTFAGPNGLAGEMRLRFRPQPRYATAAG